MDKNCQHNFTKYRGDYRCFKCGYNLSNKEFYEYLMSGGKSTKPKVTDNKHEDMCS